MVDISPQSVGIVHIGTPGRSALFWEHLAESFPKTCVLSLGIGTLLVVVDSIERGKPPVGRGVINLRR